MESYTRWVFETGSRAPHPAPPPKKKQFHKHVLNILGDHPSLVCDPMVKNASFIANWDWLLEFPNQDEQIGDAWITDPDQSLPAQLGLLHDMYDVWFDTCVSLKPQLLYLVASMELQQMPIIFTVRFLRCVARGFAPRPSQMRCRWLGQSSLGLLANGSD